MEQMCFFNLSDRYASLDAKRDPPERVNDFETVALGL